MSAPIFGALVLAAGLARRMGGPNKLLADYRGRPLAAWAVDAAVASRAARVVLVTGRDGDDVADAVGADPKLTRIHNSTPENGLSSSLKLGLAALADVDAAAILLGDMPGVDAALIDALFDRFTPDAYAIVPEIDGDIGNPVVLSREAIAECATLEGDRGARRLIEQNSARVLRVPVDTRAVQHDIDTPEDLTEQR